MSDPQESLSGAVIIIGSLYSDKGGHYKGKWDPTLREKWRADYLNMEGMDSARFPSQYGRYSGGKDGEPLIASMTVHPISPQWGRAWVVPFKRPIREFDDLKTQAFALAKAEGLGSEAKPEILAASWGLVALGINPTNKPADENSLRGRIEKEARAYWAKIGRGEEASAGYDHKKFWTVPEEAIPTTEGCLLKDNVLRGWLKPFATNRSVTPWSPKPYWMVDISKLDFVLCSVTCPENPDLTISEIANTVAGDYKRKYFYTNKNAYLLSEQEAQIEAALRTLPHLDIVPCDMVNGQSTAPFGKKDTTLSFQDGVMRVRADGRTTWESERTNGKMPNEKVFFDGQVLRFQDDGNIVIYRTVREKGTQYGMSDVVWSLFSTVENGVRARKLFFLRIYDEGNVELFSMPRPENKRVRLPRDRSGAISEWKST